MCLKMKRKIDQINPFQWQKACLYSKKEANINRLLISKSSSIQLELYPFAVKFQANMGPKALKNGKLQDLKTNKPKQAKNKTLIHEANAKVREYS